MIAFVHHRPSPEAVDRVRRALAWARNHGVDSAVLAVSADVAGRLTAEAAEPDTGLPRVLCCEAPPAHGDVAGSVAAARARFDSGAVAVIDAHAPLGFDLRALAVEHHQSPAVLTLALVPPELAEPDALRADLDRSGRVLGLVAGSLADPDQPAVDGCLIVETGLLARAAAEPRPFDTWTGFVPFVLSHGGLVGGYRVTPAPAGAG